MSHLIDLKDVGVEFPIYDAKSRSFKSQVANLTRGVISSKKESSTVTVKSLDGLTFSLKEGDKLGLIGNNGAGKSTLLKLLAGIYEPTSGTIKRKGKIVPLLDIALGMDDDSTGYQNIKL
ncbi:O89/O101/O162 family O-antigen export ABC transporter ATP-binding subunit, partial [Escherichia coli]